MFLPDVRLERRELCSCSVGCEAWEQGAPFLKDMRVESGGSCVFVESEAVGQEAVSVGIDARKQDSLFLQDVRVERRKLCSCGK